MADPRLKQIKIKTGVLKRVGKEKLSYRKEADQQKAKIEKMKEDGKDEVIDQNTTNLTHTVKIYVYCMELSLRSPYTRTSTSPTTSN